MKKTQLFLLHFAGGSRYSFQFMHPFLTEFDVIPVELPGRGRRFNEKLLTNFDQAARDFYDQILAQLTSADFIIYGHSMGAYLALRVVNMLQRVNKNPAYVIVSGNPGPGVSVNRRKYLLNKDAFFNEVKKLGGIPAEIFENEEMIEILLPVLKADFEIAEENGLQDEPAIRCPMYAIMGDEEEYVERIQNWKRFTRLSFDFQVMPGDHFFILKHPREIAAIIKQCYDKVTLLQRQ